MKFDNSVKVEIKGMKELAERLKQLPGEAARVVERKGLRKALNIIKQAAIAKTPKKTGTLASRYKLSTKWNNRTNYLNGKVINTAPHAHLVEWGHKIVAPGRSKGTKVDKERKPKIVYRKKTVGGRVPPHPFMRAAFNETSAAAMEEIVRATSAALDSWEGKK